jgi:spore coat polysaccharide biosynthesis protein SpsF
MDKILFLIQARLGSTRLPGKVLLPITDEYRLIDCVINQLKKTKIATDKNMYILTTTSERDVPLVEYLKEHEINHFCGDELNVYKRFYDFISKNIELFPEVKYFVRVCCDNPFLDSLLLKKLISEIDYNVNFDYISFYDRINNKPAIQTYFGLFAEVIKVETFLDVFHSIRKEHYKEHVTPVFYEKNKFKKKYIDIPEELLIENLRFTVDTEKDLENAIKIYKKINQFNFSYKDLIKIVKNDITLYKSMQQQIEQNTK